MKKLFSQIKTFTLKIIHHLFPIWIADFDEFISSAREFGYKIQIIERFNPIYSTNYDCSISPYINHGDFYFLELRGINENLFDIRHLILLGSTYSEGEDFFVKINKQIRTISHRLKELNLIANS